jgi:hypothetical protein
MPGGIYNIEKISAPLAVSGGAGNSYAPFLLLFHPVHGGGAVVHFANFMGTAGIEEYAFRKGGLARVDMGYYPEISGFPEPGFTRHNLSAFRVAATAPQKNKNLKSA